MKKVGIFYASTTGNCETIAKLIGEEMKPITCELYDVLKSNPSRLHDYRLLIFGISTWDNEGIHEDWEDFLENAETPQIATSIAFFGLGDQNNYPEEFVNSLGELYKKIKKFQLPLIGTWPTKGYHFRYSKAVIDEQFLGLVIDEDAQSVLTKDRVKLWTAQLKKELEYE